MTEITELNFQQTDFWSRLSELLAWEGVSDAAITETVRNILADVKHRGDQAVVEYTQRFDRVTAQNMSELEIPLSRASAALEHFRRRNVTHWNRRRFGFVNIMNIKSRSPGITPKPMARCWGNR